MRLFPKVVLAASLFTCATGYTQCNAFSDYFKTITIPQYDSSTPTNADAIYDFSEGHKVVNLGGTNPINWVLPHQDDYVLALSSAIDFSGVRYLRMHWKASVVCCNNGICESHSEPYGGILEDSQSGAPGQTASSGLWLGYSVRPSDFCYNSVPEWFVFSWTTHSEDFHGHSQDTEAGYITYTAP